MSQETMKLSIQSVISEMMDRILDRVLYQDPFLADEFRAKKPLYAALVPTEIFKGSHFERRFVTPFGSAWEKLAVVAAKEGMGHGELQKHIHGFVKQERLVRIAEVLNRLEHRGRKRKHRITPDWDEELAYILQGQGEKIPVTVVVDVYAKDIATGERLAFELKAPLPNSDQTKVSKEKLFKLYSMDPPQIDSGYYALPYNPYGKREDYAWSFPARWFNMQEDKAVLIGDEFWERIGGIGTYRAFIEAVNEIGPEYKERIYREYLGIEPPTGLSLGGL
ncbi:MAG TPA: TdeIII family type II restriction endonuclease [Caldilineae bacterium]|nr:TdeIII family type II restriction endonuclease [Caldilineae bacterium]